MPEELINLDTSFESLQSKEAYIPLLSHLAFLLNQRLPRALVALAINLLEMLYFRETFFDGLDSEPNPLVLELLSGFFVLASVQEGLKHWAGDFMPQNWVAHASNVLFVLGNNFYLRFGTANPTANLLSAAAYAQWFFVGPQDRYTVDMTRYHLDKNLDNSSLMLMSKDLDEPPGFPLFGEPSCNKRSRLELLKWLYRNGVYYGAQLAILSGAIAAGWLAIDPPQETSTQSKELINGFVASAAAGFAWWSLDSTIQCVSALRKFPTSIKSFFSWRRPVLKLKSDNNHNAANLSEESTRALSPENLREIYEEYAPPDSKRNGLYYDRNKVRLWSALTRGDSLSNLPYEPVNKEGNPILPSLDDQNKELLAFRKKYEDEDEDRFVVINNLSGNSFDYLRDSDGHRVVINQSDAIVTIDDNGKEINHVQIGSDGVVSICNPDCSASPSL